MREVSYGQHSNLNGSQISVCLSQGSPVIISEWTFIRQRHIRQVAGDCTLDDEVIELDLKALFPFNDSC